MEVITIRISDKIAEYCKSHRRSVNKIYLGLSEYEEIKRYAYEMSGYDFSVGKTGMEFQGMKIIWRYRNSE